MFLGYGGDKKFVVKGYVDASFDHIHVLSFDEQDHIIRRMM